MAWSNSTGGLAAAAPGGAAAAPKEEPGGLDGDEMDEDSEGEDPAAFLRPAPGAALKYGQGNRILTYDDLAAQVGAGRPAGGSGRSWWVLGAAGGCWAVGAG